MENSFRVGDWTVEPQSGKITRRDEVARIKPLLLRLLLCLAENAGRVVSKKQLIEEVWDGTHVTDDALTHSIFELRKILGDSARHSRIIATIPKRGYRLIAPVGLEQEGREEAGSLRFAVLPFESLPSGLDKKGFEDLECFGDAIADLLVTILGKKDTIRVVSATTMLNYRYLMKSLSEIARELGADRLLEGTVTRAESQIRVTVRLLNSEDEQVWAEIYERPWSDDLAMQRELAVEIVADIFENQI